MTERCADCPCELTCEAFERCVRQPVPKESRAAYMRAYRAGMTPEERAAYIKAAYQRVVKQRETRCEHDALAA